MHVYVGVLGKSDIDTYGLNKNVLDLARGNKVQPLEITNFGR